MRSQLFVVAIATAIVVTACGATPDADIAVNVSQTTVTESDTAAAPLSSGSAEELRADFIAAVSDRDTARVEELLTAAEPDGDLLDTLAAMMEQGVNMDAGEDDCSLPDGCYVFTDWFQAFQLRMEQDAGGNWSIAGVSLESTD